jgi:hypothetical protein
MNIMYSSGETFWQRPRRKATCLLQEQFSDPISHARVAMADMLVPLKVSLV